MSVLVFGATGKVGKILAGVDGIIAISRHSADLQRPSECAQIIHDLRPQAVINCAGLTGSNPKVLDDRLQFCINAAAPTAMAGACAKLDVPFLHISGADVFDGLFPMPYIPTDKASPNTGLGMSRLAAEEGIRAAGGSHAIVRVPMIFDEARRVVLSTLRFPKRDGAILVPSDCILAPVAAVDLAVALIQIAAELKTHPDKRGTYHFSSDEDISLSGFAQATLGTAGIPMRVIAVPQSEIFAEPMFPQNARLDCRTTQAVFGIARPSWRDAMTLNGSSKDKSWRAAI